MVSAVLDSGPLIHLAELRCFRLQSLLEFCEKCFAFYLRLFQD